MWKNFDSAKEMYDYLSAGNDLYNPMTCSYVFLYNEDGALCVYHDINAEKATELAKSVNEDCPSWSSFLGIGGNILDNNNYDRINQSDLYLERSYDFCKELYELPDWLDTSDYLKYLSSLEKEKDDGETSVPTQLTAAVEITMKLMDGESEEDAQERLYQVLYNGICKSNDDFEFTISSQEFE